MSSMASTCQERHPQVGITSLEPPCSRLSSVTYAPPEPHLNDGDEAELLSISWNQDYVCFAVGTSCGFRIYTCDPFKLSMTRHIEGGSFGIVEMLFRSNYFALVGGGASPIYSPNKVLIWDDQQGHCINQLAFRCDVRAVKLRQNHIVVVLEHEIHVFDFTDYRLIHKFGTSANPRGLCCLSHHADSFVLVCPGLLRGQVRVENFGLKATKFFSAHDSPIACLTLSLDGLLLSTASVKGTLIRIFNTVDGTCLQEVRRGADRADIYSIALSPDVQWMAVSSDKGTVHVFKLRIQGAVEIVSKQHAFGEGPHMLHQNSSAGDPTSSKMSVNPSSSLSFMKGVLPKYFSSEWSFAQFHLPEDVRCVAAFGVNNTVAIVCMNGSFYRCSFDRANGGEMVQQEHEQFLKSRKKTGSTSSSDQNHGVPQ